MRCCLVLALVGCGRFGFDPIATSASDGAVDTLDGNQPMLVAYVKASNTETFDDFGYAIALSADGNTLAVGAPQEDSGSPTNQADNTASNAGAVYIFTRTGTTWSQQAYLKHGNIGAGDLFGAALALSADGNTLVATAPGEDSPTIGINSIPTEGSAESGAAYIFLRTGTTWAQQAYLKASNTDPGDHLGQAVAISANGDVVAVGADFESSTAVGINGNQAINTAAQSGAVYVFARSGATWTQDAYVKASNTQAGDEFGYAVALSGDGTMLVVGAQAEDSGSRTNQADETVSEAGAAYVFTRGATWSQQAYVKALQPAFGDYFARRLSISATGDTLLAAGPGDDSLVANSGAAYVLARSGTVWSVEQTLKAANAGDNDQFGLDLALAGGGGAVLVAAALEDSNAAGIGGNQLDDSSADSGAVYAFDRAATWTQSAYAKPPVPSQGDNFGFAVAISNDGRTRAASMPLEDSSATGINGNAADESAPESGAVIVTYD